MMNIIRVFNVASTGDGKKRIGSETVLFFFDNKWKQPVWREKIYLYKIDFMAGFIMPVVLAVRTVSIYDADMNGWAVAFLSMPGVHVSMHVKRVFLSRQHPLFEGRHSG